MSEKKSVVDDIFDEIQRLKKEKEEAEKTQAEPKNETQPRPDQFCAYDTVTINGVKFPIIKPHIFRKMP